MVEWGRPFLKLTFNILFLNWYTIKIFLIYTSIGFKVHINLCNHQHKQGKKQCSHLQNSLFLLTYSHIPLLLLPSGNHWSVLHHSSFVWSRILYSWSPMCFILRLALFTQHDSFDIYLNCYICSVWVYL